MTAKTVPKNDKVKDFISVGLILDVRTVVQNLMPC